MTEYQPVYRPVPWWYWIAAILVGCLVAAGTWALVTSSALVSDSTKKGDRIDALVAITRDMRTDSARSQQVAENQRDVLLANQTTMLRRVKAQEVRLREIVEWLQSRGIDLPDRLVVSSGNPTIARGGGGVAPKGRP